MRTPHRATKRRKTAHSAPDSDGDGSDSASFNHATTGTDELESSPDVPEGSEQPSDEQSGSPKGLNGTELVNNRPKGQPSSPKQAMSNRESARPSWSHDFSGTAYVGEVYKSNIFKLQVDELLEQVRPKYNQHAPAIERILRTLKHVIEGIPRRDPLMAQDAERAL